MELTMPALSLAEVDADKPVLLPVGRDLVRRAMRARGLSVTALAEKLGVSRKHLSNVLNGHTPPSISLLRALGDTSGVDPVLLFCLLKRGPGPKPARYGAMKGTITVLGDPTEPMEGWEMLED
jgi:lambda repressor-like predicted transcriptional regulator